MNKCPCCKQNMPEGALLNREAAKALINSIKLGPRARKIADHLLLNYGRGVSRQQLIDMVYADDPDGGPEDPWNVMAYLVHSLRGKLKPHGLIVRGTSWHGIEMKWGAPPHAE